MDMNIKAFMKAEEKAGGTMEFPGIDRYTDGDGNPVPFIIKKLSRKEIREIRNLYKTTHVYRDRENNDRPMLTNDGQVAVLKDYDSEKAGLHIMCDAFVQPKLDDAELMKYYGALDRLDMPEIIFPTNDDFKYANECVMIACGLKAEKKEKDLVDDIKN